jgi:hypothetical protein
MAAARRKPRESKKLDAERQLEVCEGGICRYRSIICMYLYNLYYRCATQRYAFFWVEVMNLPNVISTTPREQILTEAKPSTPCRDRTDGPSINPNVFEDKLEFQLTPFLPSKNQRKINHLF